MTYLLTGATGFIGQTLCKHFIEQRANLRLLSRNVGQSLDNFPFPASFISWDHVKPNLSPSDLSCDAVIHLAGENIAGGRWTKAQKKRIWDSRIDSTKALVEMIVKSPKRPKVFICASAIGFYGDRWQEDLDETSVAGEGFLAELCQAWEKACEPLQAVGVRVVNVRSGLVLGLNQGALKPLASLCDLGLLGNMGDGRQWMSWIHVNDWVNALEFCIQNPNIEGPVNFVSPKPIEHKNFMQILASNLDRSLFVPVPKIAAKILLGEMSELFLASQKVHPKKLLEQGFQFEFKTLDDAFKQIFPNQGQEYILERTMFIPKKADEIFPFFTDPYNLEKITPPFLHFKVEHSTDKLVRQGTKIAYKLKLHGIPLKWLTKIEEFVDKTKFVDNQLKGPYSRWHHTHTFEDLNGGTLLKDRVLYRLPLHWLGRVVAHTYVTKDVNKIFNYRTKVLKQRFYDSNSGA